METRRLGNTDLDLTPVGFGTWAIGGGDWGMGWGPQEEKDSIGSILEGLESGINWIDTAHAYGFGLSEESSRQGTQGMGAAGHCCHQVRRVVQRRQNSTPLRLARN